MAETVGACALAVVAYLALRPRLDAPQWMAKPVAFSMSPAAVLDIDPVADAIRRPGSRLPIRRHDGTGRIYDAEVDVPDAFVAPLPPLPQPEPGPGPDGPIPEPAAPLSTEDIAQALDAIQARLHVALDAEYVALCATLHVPVAAPITVKHKARKGKRTNDGTAQEARRMPERGTGSAPHRGRRRRRGGVRIA